jgi:hypothetical protein
MKKIMPVLLLAALPLFAADPPKTPPAHPKAKVLEIVEDNATFCDGTYALCIKAPCEKEVSKNNEVRCVCAMETGWNMGPNSCADRKKNLTSTYSNLFNPNSATLTCPNPIKWAWCYGASCEKESKDGRDVAVCRCPVVTQTAVILIDASKCTTSDACSKMMSAASPKESSFANNHYYNWMTKHGHQADPPSAACPAQ